MQVSKCGFGIRLYLVGALKGIFDLPYCQNILYFPKNWPRIRVLVTALTLSCLFPELGSKVVETGELIFLPRKLCLCQFFRINFAEYLDKVCSYKIAYNYPFIISIGKPQKFEEGDFEREN